MASRIRAPTALFLAAASMLAFAGVSSAAADPSKGPSQPAATTTPSSSSDLAWSTEPGKVVGGAASDSRVQPMQVWGACGVITDNKKVLRTFSRHKATAPGGKHMRSGKSKLQCGRPDNAQGKGGYGYRHITEDHLGDWSTLATRTSQNWRDVADLAIESALKDPDSVSYAKTNDAFCFSRLIYLVNKRTGKTVGTNKPRTILSAGSTDIITAYPNSRQCK